MVQLRNVAANLCVDTKYRNENQRFGLEPCTKDNPGQGGEQVSVCMSCHHQLHLPVAAADTLLPSSHNNTAALFYCQSISLPDVD